MNQQTQVPALFRLFSQLALITLLTGFVSFITVTAQEPADDSGKALAETRTLITQGKQAEALTKLQSLPQTDVRVSQMMGVAFYAAGDHVHAIEKLSAVIDKLSPDSAAWRESVQILGMSHFILGHLPEAIPFLEKTLAWQPDNNELTYALGMAAIQTRQPAKARAAFARMFGVAADSPAARLLTAQMMIRVEFEDFAEAELKQALAQNPALPQANYLLGQNAIYKGRFDEGIALMQKELAINPNNANAWYKIGDALTRQLKWDEAIAALQKSVWLNPWYSGPYILLGKSYLKKGQLVNAEGMLQRAVQYDPNNKSAHYMLGQVYQQMGQAEAARREFAIAEKLQSSPDQSER